MDQLSPPALTRSPTSPPNELSYPSPPMMVEQQYKLASAYQSGASCSLPPSYDSEVSLPPLEAMSHSGWNSAPSMHAAPSSTTNVPSTTILTAEYDPFQAPYGYSQDVYPPHQQPHAAAATTHQAPSPPMDGRSRTPMPLTPRIKMESSEYPNPQDVSRYPSPPSRAIAAASSYPSDMSQYPTSTTSSSSTVAAAAAPAYTIEGQPSWSAAATKSEYHHHHPPHAQMSPMYSAAPSANADLAAQFINDARRLSRASRHPRKQQRKMTSKEDANFQCEHEGCGKLFSRSYNYKAHLETHDKQRAYPFPCPVKDCNKKFVRKTDLQRHNASVHLKERSHKCEYCGRPFARKDTLRRHMDDGCSKRFSYTLDLQPESYEPLQRPLPGLMTPHPESSLPPMTPPNSGGLLAPIPPPLRPTASWAGR